SMRASSARAGKSASPRPPGFPPASKSSPDSENAAPPPGSADRTPALLRVLAAACEQFRAEDATSTPDSKPFCLLDAHRGVAQLICRWHIASPGAPPIF